MTTTTDKVKSGLKVALLMALNFNLTVVNYRMIARGSYIGTAWSEVGCLLVGFAIIRCVAKSECWQDRAGYIAGGLVGSLLGLYFTGA